MKKIRPIRLAMFAFSLVFTLSLASICFAYKVGPAVIDMTVPRGKTKTDALSLRGNIFNEEVFLYLVDIVLDRKGVYRFERLEDWKYSALDWLKLYKSTSVTKVGEELKIVGSLYKEKEIITLKIDRDTYVGIKVKAPFNIKSGQYYAGIIVEPTGSEVFRGVVEGKAIAIERKTRIAVPITISVPGATPKLNGKAIETSADIKEEEIKILSTFENTGNVLEYVKGKAQIINKKDGRIYDVVTMNALNPQAIDGTGKIFPGSLRDFEGVVKRPLPVGDYEIRIAFDYGLKIRKARAKADFSVTQELAISLKELLTLATDSELLEFELKPGGLVMKGLEIMNLDFQPLRVAISTLPEKMPWLRITQTKLNLKAGGSRKIRFRIKIPRDEKVERSARIVLTPERGKSIIVNLVIKEVANPENQ